MSTQIKTQSQLASVTQFNCQGCGAAHEVVNPRAKFIVCQYCGSVLDAQSEEHQILRELGKPNKYKPFSVIRLGQTCQFDGYEYQVIARTRWRMNYKEYWAEEGETGYSNEIWSYDEWLLINHNRTYFYLIEDQTGFWVSDEIVPETPMLLPNNLRMSFFKGQGGQIVREYGEAEVVHFEGETNYQIKKGDKIRFAMFKDRGIEYSAEWRLDETGEQIKEIEFFREAPMSRRRVLEAFSGNPEIDELRVRLAKWRYVFGVAMVATIACLLLLVISVLYDGSNVFAEKISLSQLSENQPATSQALEVTEPGLYKLELAMPAMAENSEAFVFAYVLDQEQQAINTLEGSFYYWTGVEDGERWTERKQKSSLIFKLQEPGTYYLQLFKSGESTQSATVEMRLNKGILLTRYFVLAMVLCLVVVLISAVNMSSRK